MKKLALIWSILVLSFVAGTSVLAYAVGEIISAGATPVSEPGKAMLLGFGLFGLAVYVKRRSNKLAAM